MFKVKNVTSDCFTKQKFLLNCFGLLHNQNVFRQVYQISLLISLTIYFFSVFPEILKVYDVDFNKFIYYLIVENALLTCLICMYFTFWNRFELKQLFEKLQLLDNLSNFKNPRDENVFIKEYKDATRKQANLGISWISIIHISFTSISVAISLDEEKWILPFGSRSVIINNDNIQFIIQIAIVVIMTVHIILTQIIYMNALTLICGHCKLLRIYIALTFTGYQGEIFKELNVELIEKEIPDWTSFQIQLQQIIPYHIGIIDAAHQMETVFSFISLIVFGGISISMCLLIYHTQLNIEILDIVKDANLLALGYSIMIIISSYGEDVATESGKIANACYELDFVGCDLRIQKSLILIMAISQRQITPTIGKMKVLGLSTMLSILQSIYSYYTILRNVINKRN